LTLLCARDIIVIMTYLIVPDIHQEINQLNEILIKYNHIQKKISLGDWYDTHGDNDTPNDVAEVARMHADFINNPNHICLMGNHDINYAYTGIRDLSCSGHGVWKQLYINSAMKTETWDKVRLFYWMIINKKNWLLSHAGVHPYFFKGMENVADKRKHLNFLSHKAKFNLKTYQKVDEILQPGESRGGNHPTGGLTWLDFREFKPIPEINQIVGHTHNPGFGKDKIIIFNSENYCIDGSSSVTFNYMGHVAILEDDGTCHVEEI